MGRGLPESQEVHGGGPEVPCKPHSSASWEEGLHHSRPLGLLRIQMAFTLQS